MTESERDLLMPFLRNLVQTRSRPGDEAALGLIRTALSKQPHADYLLVQRALALECELAAAQRRIRQLEGQAQPGNTLAHSNDFLNLATSGWGEPVDRHAPPSTSKKLYDFFKDGQAARKMDLESRAFAFVGRHAAKIWLGILALAALVVLFTDKAT